MSIQEEGEDASRAFKAAKNSVGVRLRKNLDWLIEFSKLKTTDLEPFERSRLCNDVRVFCLLASTNTPEEVIRLFKQSEQRRVQPVEWKDVLYLQVTIQRVLGNIVEGTACQIGYSKKRISVTSTRKSGKTVLRALPHYEDHRSPFYDHFARVVEAFGGTLARCQAEDCRSMFSKQTPWQEYCKPKCRVRIEMRKLRAKQRTPFASKRRKSS